MDALDVRVAPKDTAGGRGQAVVMVIVVSTMVVMLMMAVARFGARVSDAERAQAAADAAALAAVDGCSPLAARLAAANGAVLVACREVADGVVVTVDVGGARATARATRAP